MSNGLEIYIPSKGRPNGKTFRLLNEIKHYVVVEPQDVDLYINAGHDPAFILVLPENNKGIAYVRNFIKRRYKSGLMVIVDDDIDKFDYLDTVTGKMTRKENRPEALEYFCKLYLASLEVEFDLATLGMRQFVWSQRKKYSENCFVGTITLINSKTDIWYDDSLRCKEDIDLTLQYIYADKKVIRFNEFVYDHHMVRHDNGGLAKFYEQKKDLPYVQVMIDRWPLNCTSVEKFGRIDLKTKYKKF